MIVARKPTSSTFYRLACIQTRHFSSTPEEGDGQFKTTAELKKAIISAAFLHAKTVGFNDSALVEACKDFGYSPVTAGVVKNGPIEVVDYAMDLWLAQMREELSSNEDLGTLKIRERVSLGIKTRLELEVPYKSVWPQAMALGAHPLNMPKTAQ
jgi:ubiquinone biosynthesis protein COQ9